MLILIYLVSVLCSVRAAIFYDSYSGNVITREEVKKHDVANTTFWCVNEIEPCDPNEGRRVDGSCNNLQHPQRGATHTLCVRVLPPVYDKNFEPRKAASGNDLPLPRYLRTRLVSVGRVPSPTFTLLAIHYFAFMTADVVSFHDTLNYLLWKPHCCTEGGKTDYMCASNKIPDDDPVHRFSGVRCLNMTRPTTFQTIGCIQNDTAPERIVSATPLLDLSVIYGSELSSLSRRGRTFQRGLVKTELDGKGRIWPPSTKTTPNFCFLNQKPQETRCHAMPEDGVNTLAGVNLLVVWFWRNHNFISKKLAAVNPCWNDDKLFNVTRDINIALSIQLYYYELLPLYMGYDNMVNDGVISPTGRFRDDYNPNLPPQVSMEYPFVMRWLHTLQNGPVKMYDKNGYYLKQIPIVNLTMRTGYLGIDDNMDYLTQGSFRQSSGGEDYIADPYITELGLGPLQYASDLLTNDLAKNRYYGFPPYVKYREFCFGRPIRRFKDLNGAIDPQRIEILRDAYEKVEDIDLLAGIWLEKRIPGSFVPPTFYCLVMDQLKRNMMTDRHWYERPDRPNAFTFEQLAEIRKYSIARLLCDVGDTVERIQPRAFLKAGYNNQMCSCDQIDKMDFSHWKDPKCCPLTSWPNYVP